MCSIERPLFVAKDIVELRCKKPSISNWAESFSTRECLGIFSLGCFHQTQWQVCPLSMTAFIVIVPDGKLPVLGSCAVEVGADTESYLLSLFSASSSLESIMLHGMYCDESTHGHPPAGY